MTNKHSHYHKDVSHLKSIDVYRVLELFEVTDHALGHAIKKLICAGKRGSKSFETDVREAADTLNRRLQMLAEDDNQQLPPAPTGSVQPRYAGLGTAVPVAHMGGLAPPVAPSEIGQVWIMHTGKQAPAKHAERIQVELKDGDTFEPSYANACTWPNWAYEPGHPDRIKRYRWLR